MSALDNPHRCAEHPRAPAGWHCTDCGRKLCPDCVRELSARSTAFDVCAPCGGRPERLFVPGTEERFGPHLARTLLLPVGVGEFLLALGTCLFVGFLLPEKGATRLGWVGFLASLYLPSLAAGFWLRAVAEPGSPWKLSDAARQAGAILVTTLALVGLGLLPRIGPWLLVLAGGPAVFALAAVAVGPGRSLARVHSALRSELPLTAAVAVPVLLLARFLFARAALMTAEGLGFHGVATAAGATYLLTLLPRLAGLLLYVHGERAGYPFVEPRWVLALGQARGRAPVA